MLYLLKPPGMLSVTNNPYISGIAESGAKMGNVSLQDEKNNLLIILLQETGF